MSALEVEGEQVVQNVLNDIIKVKELTSSKNTDKELLQALANNPIVQSLAKAHTGITEKKIKPKTLNATELSLRISEHADELAGDFQYEELRRILVRPHLVGLLKCHDSVAQRNGLRPSELHGTQTNGKERKKPMGLAEKPVRAIRIVGMYKKSWEPLGITVVKEKGELRIARILRGSEIEKKGLLHIDDVILEVNGNLLHGDPMLLRDYLIKTTGSLVFKILPSYEENPPPKLLYVKCHIDFDPATDKSIPCVEAGLGFKRGDILQVVEQTDTEWWQAQRVNNKGEARGRAGLIPSQSFEEKRRVILERPIQTSHEKKRKRKSLRRMYSVSRNSAFDKHDIAVYEEVACIPPISRKTLVLLMQSQNSAEEVGQEIVNFRPDHYGIATTSEESADKSTISRSSDISPGELHSYESDNALNQKLRSARTVMKDGKTCVVIASPQCLKVLRTSEFLPYVAYIKLMEEAENGVDSNDQVFEVTGHDIEKYYMQYIDTTVEYTSASEVAKIIVEQMDLLKKRHQWVPTSWVY